ncbi:MAG: hypothetical protein KGO96_14140 [Elusimicrobia bacterium]|nr:hypothetical protein [Elusimicrobiota bacterium]
MPMYQCKLIHQTDFWPDGIYDNRATNRREVWLNGKLCRYVRRNAVNQARPAFPELREPWGYYPDIPPAVAA